MSANDKILIHVRDIKDKIILGIEGINPRDKLNNQKGTPT